MNKTNISILTGLAGMVGWGSSYFFADLATAKAGYFKTFFWSQFYGVILLLILFPFNTFVANYTPLIIFLLFINALLYSFGYLFFFKAFEIGNISIVSTTINLNVVLAMVLASILFKQTLSPIGVVAIILVLLGLLLLAYKKKENRVKLTSGIKEVLAASFFFAFYWLISEALSESLGFYTTSLMLKVGSLLILSFFSVIIKKSVKTQFAAKLHLLFFVSGILETLAILLVNVGLAWGDLILVSPISGAFSLVTITLAVIFLKERLTCLQIVGIAVTIIGITLTSF